MRNLPLALLEINYTILANQAMAADNRTDARN
jgi:hypothetical protein